MMNKLNLLPAFIIAAGFYSAQAVSAVPAVDTKGVAASTTCPVPTATVPSVNPSIKHFDKVIFQITVQPGQQPLIAINPADQAALDDLVKLRSNTDLDIKIIDKPSTVADLKSKVLTFLGAADIPDNRNFIRISDVEYSAVVCPKLP